ncbi:MAG TPA: hypothetical protein PLC42_01000, partial [Parachlamydiaceae bacterium]|nr:hypothetical protein [Parachlamydiaceae bacterium]
FEILTNSKQTGFPHPMQHTGWALADCMIPLCPSRPELLKDFLTFFKLKHQTALELLPKGCLIAKAKDILKLKRQVFEENKELFLEKHQKLCTIMFGEKIKIKIEPFFNRLKASSSSYSHFAEAQEMLMQQFIANPFEKLKEAFLEERDERLFSKDKNVRYLAALSILKNEQEKALHALTSDDNQDSDFICCMGPLIGKNANAILLQHFSETAGFTAPSLNNDEKKMQAALYKQLIAFQKELNEELSKESILSHFVSEMDSDIQLFSSSFDECQGTANKIVAELECYYNL